MMDIPVTSENQSKRKPGAQPGNTNSLKDGFYSRRFKPTERRDLAEYAFRGVADEIALFRIQFRRILETGEKASTFSESLNYFRAVSHALANFARLVRAEHYMVVNPPPSNEPSTNDLLEEAIQEVLAEMRADDEQPDYSI